MRAAALATVLALLAGCSYGYVEGSVSRETVTSCVRGAGVTGQYALKIHRARGAETYRVPPGYSVSELQSREINACIAQAETPALRRRVGLFGQYTRCNSVFDRGSDYCINNASQSTVRPAYGPLNIRVERTE